MRQCTRITNTRNPIYPCSSVFLVIAQPRSNSGKTTCPNEISKASLRRSTGESRNHCTLGFRQTFLVPVSWPGSPMQSVTKWPGSGFTKTSMFSRATELPVTLLMAATRSIMSSVLGNVCSWSLINSFFQSSGSCSQGSRFHSSLTRSSGGFS